MLSFVAIQQERLETFGVDPLSGLPNVDDESGAVDDESGAVVVPATPCPLDSDSFSIFQERVCSVRESHPWDIEPYLLALRTLEDMLSNVH